MRENVSVDVRALSAREGDIREFKKVRLLLQRKHHFKIAHRSNISVLRLFHDGYFVQWAKCSST